MDQEKDIETPDAAFDLAAGEPVEDAGSVDDFLRKLEEKEKDLHITSETTFIELAADMEEDEVPDFIREELAANPKKPEPQASAKPDMAKAVLKMLEAELSAARSENNTLRNESAALLKKIADLKEERTELYHNAYRRLKDFESYKTRTERERGETFQRQLSNLATQMLPALDNLDRALQFASSMAAEKQSEFTQFFDGIVLVNQQVNEVLAEMGIESIPSVGHPFDPHYHEAVAVETSAEHEPNTITAELLRGFRIGDKVVRHSMVRVAQATMKPKAEPAPVPEAEAAPADAAEGPDELEKVSGEFDPEEVVDTKADDASDAGEPKMREVEEPQDTAPSIERGGEAEEPKKGRPKGSGEKRKN